MAAINFPGSYAAITLESFVAFAPAAGPGIPIDPQAGNRTDYWCGLAASTVPFFHSNRPDLVTVAGTGQIFSHFSASASRSDTQHMHSVAVDNVPELPFPIVGQSAQPCLQAVAFSDPADDSVSLSLSMLNICNQTINATLQVAAAQGAKATVYKLTDGGPVDPGPLHQNGWAPLPNDPDVLPWKSGPLSPTTAEFAATAGNFTLPVPGLTFVIADFV
uniref:Non-reducing end alpha-L-arabinofuranosidase n=1 Tax=Haptolina brevifila TaxID=156173 RepID=A0A7S2I0D5_9EUKA